MQHLNLLFFVGQNKKGNWVVTDGKGLRGGLFISSDAAFRFAMRENGHHLERIVWVTGTIELDGSAAVEGRGAEASIAENTSASTVPFLSASSGR
jgi:hypothetical protein